MGGMQTVKGTSASGKALRVIQIRKHGKKLMINIARDGHLFKRQGAVIVSVAELLRKIGVASKG
jgi:hypothetical protein